MERLSAAAADQAAEYLKERVLRNRARIKELEDERDAARTACDEYHCVANARLVVINGLEEQAALISAQHRAALDALRGEHAMALALAGESARAAKIAACNAEMNAHLRESNENMLQLSVNEKRELVATLTASLRGSRKNVQQLEGERDRLDGAVKELEGHVTALRESRDAALLERDAARADAKTAAELADEQLEALRGELRETAVEKGALEEQLAAQRAEQQLVEARAERLAAQADADAQELARLRADCDANATLGVERDAARAESQEHLAAVEVANARIAELEAALSSAQESAVREAAERERAVQLCERRQGEMKAFAAECDVEVARAKDRLYEMREQLLSAKEVHAQELNGVKDQLRDAKVEAAELRVRIAALEGQVLRGGATAPARRARKPAAAAPDPVVPDVSKDRVSPVEDGAVAFEARLERLASTQQNALASPDGALSGDDGALGDRTKRRRLLLGRKHAPLNSTASTASAAPAAESPLKAGLRSVLATFTLPPGGVVDSPSLRNEPVDSTGSLADGQV